MVHVDLQQSITQPRATKIVSAATTAIAFHCIGSVTATTIVEITAMRIIVTVNKNKITLKCLTIC